MISSHELLELKSRLMIGAEAAGHIASSADPVRYEQEQYEAVYAALVSMKSDLTRVLAELDVLRGMVWNGVSLFIAEKKHGNGMPDAGGDVVAVPEQAAGGSGEGEPPVGAGPDGGVQKRRAAGKRTKRSNARRNKGGDGVLPVAVGPGDGGGEVDRGEVC